MAQEACDQSSRQAPMAVHDAQGVHMHQVADGGAEQLVESGVGGEVGGIEVHARQLGEDVGRRQMAAVGQGLDLGRKAGVGGQDVQLLDYGGIVVLVRVGSLAQRIVGLVAGARRPLVDQADVLPQEAGRMAAEGARAEGGALQVGSLEVEDDQLQQLLGEVFELARVVSAYAYAYAYAYVGGAGTIKSKAPPRETHWASAYASVSASCAWRVCPALAGCSRSHNAGRASRGGCTERVFPAQGKKCTPCSSSWG